MNDYLVAIILGIIEGLTEFLPISSTGHMIIAQPLLGVDPEADGGSNKWNVFLFVSQLGAILAVVVYFWRDLWRRTFHAKAAHWPDHILVKLFAAMVPTVIIGLALDDWMEATFEKSANGPVYVAIALIVGAALIYWIDARFRRTGEMAIENVTLIQAIAIGFCQCLAMWPGTSRAGATIMGGMVLGLTPRVATEFSFYLAIPTMLAAGGYRLLKYREQLTPDALGVILVGTAVSFVVALAVVAGFMSYVRRRKFTPFAIYRVLLGVAVLAWCWSAREA